MGVRFPPRLAPKTIPHPKVLIEIPVKNDIRSITGTRVKVMGILSTSEEDKPQIQIFKIEIKPG